ncbi:MAG: DUF2490 domain-containing protein [Prevotella sp.]|nr:DUF2490 domain-containing protein [Prevotella sp.]
MKKTIITLMLLCPLLAHAQSDDFGIWTTVNVEKKIDKKWSAKGEVEFRSRNNSRTADCWNFEADINYKPVKWLKVALGYMYMIDNEPEKLSYNDDGGYNNWRPSCWASSHRVLVNVTGSKKFGRIELSLRERWQYTYRPEKMTTRYDFDNAKWEDTPIKGKGKHLMRSRLTAEYDIPKCKIRPYASVEVFNDSKLDKVRYTVGAEYKIKKIHTFDVFYRYQQIINDDTPNRHILGLGYKYKF